ncbi:hypothetical protein, variant [Aphanomyces invadans]|uniref:ATP-dependent RNA helicase n=1 Tax=Aphanomyces invadans TaxID=157072 RepID=A0A024U699_9STRA|nr:hypothetical protein, variant [Aphanomyces invadans]ETW01804.1 hypothetical protein, variant [Aphanomyces invadans]|eukprot:XP_008869652.1 hypothetical protein, variant [Aphanomyces invadans]
MLRLFSRSLPMRRPSFLRKHMSSAYTHVSDMPVTSLAISKPTMRALTEVMGYSFLTKVQATTLPVILEGKDVLAKSKTGTGKTMAFLIPTIETLVHTHLHKKQKNNISALILSPSRELATQIEVEAKKLSTFHPIHIACIVGGVPMSKDLHRLHHPDGIDLLVATPGRLQDHLNSDNGDLVRRLAGIRILVLDEADRLLDMGFRRDIEKLLQFLPVSRRQTLLFSATLPTSLDQIQKLALKTNHVFIDTVGDDEDQTHVHVKQSVVTCQFKDHIAALDKLLDAHIQSSPDGYKIIVFFPTARAAGFMAQLFLHAGYPVLEMHSRKSQSHRTKTAANFRARDNQILFSSDVSARGVDYPGVTLVIQVGLTEKEQYIHRLGRTGRAGKDGEGVLLLSPFETPFLNELNDMQLVETTVPRGKAPRVENSMRRVQSNADLRKAAEQAYQAWLGYYNSNLRRLNMNKEQLVDMAEEYSRIVGLKEVPALQKSIISKMGLKGTGLRVAATSGGGSGHSGGRGGGSVNSGARGGGSSRTHLQS